MSKKIKLGRYGENIAANYYKKRGYSIIATNLYSRYGEIDLIISKNSQITLVEVKTTSSKKFIWPEEKINVKKLDNIINTYYSLKQKNNFSDNFNIEILIIEIIGKKIKIYRYKI